MSEFINNSEQRIRHLQDIILRLHAGADPASVKAELKQVVAEATPGEVAAMEQELLARGMQAEEIMSMCDLHHQVLDEVLAEGELGVPAGHPVDVMRRENEALAEVIVRTRFQAEHIAAGKAGLEQREKLQELCNALAEIGKHYERKEQLFFSVLERHGVDGPSQVMWGKDDEARQALKLARAGIDHAAEDGALATICREQLLPALEHLDGMIQKEERILLPMCMELFTEQEWGEIAKDSPEYGYCLVMPAAQWHPAQPEPGPQPAQLGSEQGIDLGSGVLTPEQLVLIFTNLSVDVTFVDEHDKVRFFSETPDRVFARSRTIIGRSVQHCHPPHSVHIVQQILEDFRIGRQSRTSFWIQLGDKFVYITYVAVRDADGQYRGCLEMTQDIAGLRALEGERRLLQYE